MYGLYGAESAFVLIFLHILDVLFQAVVQGIHLHWKINHQNIKQSYLWPYAVLARFCIKRIAKGVRRGVSTEYYDRLKNTPVEELLAGNITHSLNKNILKVISHEI